MTEKKKLTKTEVEGITAPESGQVIRWDKHIVGFGVRVSAGGARTFFYQGRLNRKEKKINIGRLGKINADEARSWAKHYQAKLELGIDPNLEREGKQVATLGDVLTAYCDLLESKGKVSASDVRGAVYKHVRDANKRLWNKAANDVEMEEVTSVIRKVREKGNHRRADQIRSYVKAAYSAARNAKGKTDVPESMVGLGITTNPARDIEKVEGSSEARERVLSLAELQSYWQKVQTLPEPRRSVLTIHLLTGGQRIEQLKRATLSDIDRESNTITLPDMKGRRTKAYMHTVPLLPEVLEAIDRITGGGAYVMTANGGKSPFNKKYMSNAVETVCTAMEKDKTLEGERFTPGAIRATVETRLGKRPYRVPRWIRGYLLSHGMGGVQAKNYEFDDFTEEKLEVLMMLRRMIDGQPEPSADVIDMRARA